MWVFSGGRAYPETYMMTVAFAIIVAVIVLRFLTVLIPTVFGKGGLRILRGRVVFGSSVYFSVKLSEIVRYEIVKVRNWGVDLPHLRLHMTGNRKRDLPIYLVKDGAGQAIEALRGH